MRAGMFGAMAAMLVAEASRWAQRNHLVREESKAREARAHAEMGSVRFLRSADSRERVS